MNRKEILYSPVLITAVLLSIFLLACHSTEKPPYRPAAIDNNPSSAFLSPEQSLKTMHLPEGYHLELVASEPVIQEPVAIVWDGNGKMYVAEMRSYMQDIEGTGQHLPICRITLLEDTDRDGKMDKHSVFIDSLVLPRMMLTLDDRLIVNETLYTGPASTAPFCVPGGFVPAQISPQTFVLADRLASCHISYQQYIVQTPSLEQWVPVWNKPDLPSAVHVDMAPLAADTATLPLVSVTVPIHVTRQVMSPYADSQ